MLTPPSRRITRLLRHLATGACLIALIVALFSLVALLASSADRAQRSFALKRYSLPRPVCHQPENSLYHYYDKEPEFQVLVNMGDTVRRKVEFDPTLKAIAGKKETSPLEKKKSMPKVSAEELARKQKSKLLVYTDVVFEPWKWKDSFMNFPRISYFNGHRGCDENLHGVLSKLGLNFNIVNPRNVTKYGMSGTDARELLDSGYIAKLCNASDIIIIADTVPDGRAILLSLLEPSESLNRCKSNIVIEMTNRYDWMVPDRQVYHEMLRRIFKLNPKNLFWTANNPFEGPFMHANVGGEVFPKVRLLRPLGAWNVDVENSHMTHGMPLNQETNISTQNMLAMVKNVEKVNRPIVGDLVDYYCMPVAKLPKKYGGPAGLLKYKGFIDFPYQVSVMKFYENIAFGVPQVLPTPRFLHALVKTNNHHYFETWMEKLEEVQLFLTDPSEYSIVQSQKEAKYKAQKQAENKKDLQELQEMQELADAKEILDNSPKLERRSANNRNSHKKERLLEIRTSEYNATWTELADFYRKEFEPFVYTFDSFKELALLINKPFQEFDYKNVRLEGPKYYARVRNETMATWIQMFHAMGYTHIKQL